MNGFYKRLLGRLPSLWRPDEDPGGGESLPLSAADIAAINGQPLPPGRRHDAHGAVIVELDTATDIQEVTANRTLPPGAMLHLHPLDQDGRPYTLPSASAAVRGTTAALAPGFHQARFALRLRRPDLMTRWLRAIGSEMGAVHRGAGEVQQGHWSTNADSALTHPWVHRWHQLDGSRAPRRGEDEYWRFPYLIDLARVGSLLQVAPWIDPPALRDTVETYRLRLRRTVELYRRGLGTVGALRRMVAAELPQDLARTDSLRDRAFSIEERSLSRVHRATASTRAQPAAVLAPLMRWTMHNQAIEPAPQDLVVSSATGESPTIGPTVDPLIELERAGSRPLRLGLGVRTTLAAGQSLRLRHRWMSVLASDAGLSQARQEHDPAAPGPWTPIADSPTGSIQALCQGADRWLYLAVASGADASTLWRWDGRAWQQLADGLPTMHCLLADGDALLAGTATGLLQITPPRGTAPLAITPPPAERSGPAVFALLLQDGERWRGTAEGCERWDGSAWQPAGIHADLGLASAVHALHLDRGGNLFAGGPFGLVQWQKRSDRWFIYSGVASDDDAPDWIPLGDSLPADAELGLPAVHAILRTRDESLWLGTSAGLARWHAERHRNTYTTLLSAYPSLGTGAVRQLAIDARDQLWIAGADGLYHFDGRDWWQLQGQGMVRLGVAPRPRPGEDPVLMRYQRGGGWRYHDPQAADDWLPVPADDFASSGAAVGRILWCDAAVAELGSLDGDAFTPASELPAEQLVLRLKPDEETIVDGGIPAVPRLPPGASRWRYLQLEGDAPRTAAAHLPAWTTEGRLLPPSGTPVADDPSPRFAEQAPWPGRFERVPVEPRSSWSEVAFSYPPTARVAHRWRSRAGMTALVRLRRWPGEDAIHPAVLERIQRGIQQVRPAGVHVALAVDDTIVEGTLP